MLRIRQLAGYTVARYPRMGGYIQPPRLAGMVMRDAAALVALAALLDACTPGTTSGVPVQPLLVTEANARQIINQVFADSNIELTMDRPLTVYFTPQDSVLLTLDGFNDSLQVGYEYVIEGDFETFTPWVRHELDSTKYTVAPHILTIEPIPQAGNPQVQLEQMTQVFLDSLRAHGVI